MKTKLFALGAALVAALAGTAANADGGKHFYRGPVVVGGGGYVRPAYVAPAHGYRHGYWRPGYWSGGRWIAPVFVAAAIGGIGHGKQQWIVIGGCGKHPEVFFPGWSVRLC